MPRFYFHLRCPSGLDRDEIGLDLDGVEAAYLEACAAIPAIAAELCEQRANPHRHAFEIVDAAGTLLMDVPFAEVLDPRRKRVRPTSPKQWRKALVEMERTARLITELAQEQSGLRASLDETKRLLAEARKAGRSAP